ncbi:MAG: phosphate ABC transporter substrate-binding protein PstS family protein [Oscillospiraceae bacterium]|jgi:phosphate transport system substrate-binding protein|nr:phosphate ABC transporter substrate-binding protein PstS family protein [Oscillospiraceae bacterium]
MFKSKRIFALALTFSLILCVVSFSTLAAEPVKLVIDGKTIACEVPPDLENGTTFVPIRVVTETLGAEVDYDSATRNVTVKTSLHVLIFTIGSKDYTVNGVKKTLLAAPRLKDNRTMMPIRALSESIGATVGYVESTRTATVDYFSKMTGSLKISGSTTVQPIATAAAEALKAMSSGLAIDVAGGGSGAGINEATEGSVNIGMSSSALKPEQAEALSKFVIAYDGVAIIVNNDNPVKNLSKEQAQKVFTGEIKNWKDVGGNDAPILVQTRETGSGTLATLEDLLLGKGVEVVGSATPHNSTALLQQEVAKSKNAIGFISSGYVDGTIKALTIGNIAPTMANIKSNTYPICRELILVTKGAPGALAATYIDYLRSEAGQSIVAKEKYIRIDE